MHTNNYAVTPEVPDNNYHYPAEDVIHTYLVEEWSGTEYVSKVEEPVDELKKDVEWLFATLGIPVGIDLNTKPAVAVSIKYTDLQKYAEASLKGMKEIVANTTLKDYSCSYGSWFVRLGHHTGSYTETSITLTTSNGSVIEVYPLHRLLCDMLYDSMTGQKKGGTVHLYFMCRYDVKL